MYFLANTICIVYFFSDTVQCEGLNCKIEVVKVLLLVYGANPYDKNKVSNVIFVVCCMMLLEVEADIHDKEDKVSI